jgi:hypothetical protein
LLQLDVSEEVGVIVPVSLLVVLVDRVVRVVVAVDDDTVVAKFDILDGGVKPSVDVSPSDGLTVYNSALSHTNLAVTGVWRYVSRSSAPPVMLNMCVCSTLISFWDGSWHSLCSLVETITRSL